MQDRIVETQNNTPTPHVIMFNQSNFILLYLTNPESFPSHTINFHHKTHSQLPSVNCIRSWTINVSAKEWYQVIALHFTFFPDPTTLNICYNQHRSLHDIQTYTYAVAVDKALVVGVPCGSTVPKEENTNICCGFFQTERLERS